MCKIAARSRTGFNILMGSTYFLYLLGFKGNSLSWITETGSNWYNTLLQWATGPFEFHFTRDNRTTIFLPNLNQYIWYNKWSLISNRKFFHLTYSPNTSSLEYHLFCSMFHLFEQESPTNLKYWKVFLNSHQIKTKIFSFLWLNMQFVWKVVRLVGFGLVLWHINHCWLFKPKSCFYIYIKYMIYKHIFFIHC